MVFLHFFFLKGRHKSIQQTVKGKMFCIGQHYTTDAWIFNGAFGWDWKVIHPSAVNPQPQEVCVRVERHWLVVWTLHQFTSSYESAGSLRSHRFATAQQYSFRNVWTAGKCTFYFLFTGALMLSFGDLGDLCVPCSVNSFLMVLPNP